MRLCVPRVQSGFSFCSQATIIWSLHTNTPHCLVMYTYLNVSKHFKFATLMQNYLSLYHNSVLHAGKVRHEQIHKTTTDHTV